MKAIYFKNLLISLLVLAAWSAITLLTGSRSQTPLDYGMTLFAGLWVLRICGLCGGGLVFLFRITKSINKRTNFFYFFFAVANLLLGILGVLLLVINESNRQFFHQLLLNLFIGVILSADIFLFNALFNNPTDSQQ